MDGDGDGKNEIKDIFGQGERKVEAASENPEAYTHKGTIDF